MDVANAGLVIGIATVLGGVGGLLLGAHTVDRLNHRVRNAYFFFPAIFTIPATVLAWFAINIKSSAASSVFFCVSQIFIWTYISPMGVVAVNAISPDLRSRATGASIFVQVINFPTKQ